MKRFSLFILGILLLLAAAWLGEGFFHKAEICTTCGAQRHTDRYLWIPFWKVTQTPLSGFYRRNIAENCPHAEWLFIAGSGGPISCALGRGRAIHGDEETVRALEMILQHRGKETALQWFSRLMDPKTSNSAMLALSTIGSGLGSFDEELHLAEEFFHDNQKNQPR